MFDDVQNLFESFKETDTKCLVENDAFPDKSVE